MRYTMKDDRTLAIAIDSIFYTTIQEFLDDFIPSRKIQHLLIQNKWLRMDGNPVKREDDIMGLNLEINLYPETYAYQPADMKPDVVYEDELLLVVNKPKEVLVHDDGNDIDCLSRWVEGYYVDRPYIAAQPLHRLDKETTGLVAYSKSIIFQPLLDKYLSEKQLRRYYLAFVKGRLDPGTSLTIDKPIGRDRHDAAKRIVNKNGQRALTKARSLGYSKKGYTIMRCVLYTGRTHQIRVHLANEQLPILNDSLYGVRSDLCIRMGLMADELEFYHPLKEENVLIEADLPNDLAKLYFEVIH